MSTFFSQIPETRWRPISVGAVQQLFQGAPFAWALAGGYAIEQFLDRSLRDHGDIDVIVFRDEQTAVQQWLSGWRFYVARSKTLQLWQDGENLPFGAHNIWGHQADSDAWQLQLMLMETEGQEWFSRRNSKIRGPRDALIVDYRGIPCLRVEVQLLYKANRVRPKDNVDFLACLPHLRVEAKQWLVDNLRLQNPAGHVWLEYLEND